MNLRTATLTLFPAASLLILVACGGGGSTPAPAPVPPAAALAYTNPTTGTYRLVKNDTLSTATHLVLDVTGVGAPSGAGIAFTCTVDTTRATWAKVVGTDAEYIQKGDVFTLGNVPIGIKGKVATATLTAGLGQKGIVSPVPVALNGVLARVALDLKTGAPVGTTTLTSPMARIIAVDGTITDVTVVPGTLSAH